MGNATILDGQAFRSNSFKRYEKTTSDDEFVEGLIATRGSSDSQLKICGAGNKPLAVFTKQMTRPGMNGGKYDSDYAHDGEPVDYNDFGQFIFSGWLTTDQTITKGDALEVTAGGKLQALSTGYRVGYAMESKTTTSSAARIKVLWAPAGNVSDLVVAEETITVSSNSGTLSNTPKIVESVEATAGTVTGYCKIGYSAAPANSLECQVVHSTKTLNFLAADAVTEAKVRYLYEA